MPIAICEIDLSAGLGPLTLEPGYESLWLVVRAGRRPLGMVRLGVPAEGRVLGVEVLKGAIEAVMMGTQTHVVTEPTAGRAPERRGPISVVVCTRDRPESLGRCLEALGRLDYPDYEVVVVDNASRDATTREVVEGTGLRYVREDRPGLDWARNRGAAEARHGIIAYTDDDVQVDRSWLCGIAEAFGDPQVAAVTGLVLPAELETEAQLLFERYGGMGKGFKPRLFRRQELGETALVAAHNCGVGANMAFRRSTLHQVGGFDTALDVGTPSCGGGDLDMFHRVLAAGLALYYEPSAMVWHQHRRDRAGLRRQLYCNGRSFGVYLGKIWRDQTVPRPTVARYAAHWVGGYLGRRLLDRARGRLDFPLDLVWAEFWGMTHAPAAFWTTFRRDAAFRRQTAGQLITRPAEEPIPSAPSTGLRGSPPAVPTARSH